MDKIRLWAATHPWLAGLLGLIVLSPISDINHWFGNVAFVVVLLAVVINRILLSSDVQQNKAERQALKTAEFQTQQSAIGSSQQFYVQQGNQLYAQQQMPQPQTETVGPYAPNTVSNSSTSGWPTMPMPTAPSPTPVAPSPMPTASELSTLAQIALQMTTTQPRDLVEEIEVVGEFAQGHDISALFAAAGISLSPYGEELDRDCVLVPEPTNQYDPYAVAVLVGPYHVGYLPKERAREVSATLTGAARTGALVTGHARVWAKNDGQVRSQVTIMIPSMSMVPTLALEALQRDGKV